MLTLEAICGDRQPEECLNACEFPPSATHADPVLTPHPVQLCSCLTVLSIQSDSHWRAVRLGGVRLSRITSDRAMTWDVASVRVEEGFAAMFPLLIGVVRFSRVLGVSLRGQRFDIKSTISSSLGTTLIDSSFQTRDFFP